jgi:hypothetical protein
MTHSCLAASITAADHESGLYTKNREWVSKKRLDARSDFDEWANRVVAAVKAHRSRFGASAGGAPAQSRIGLRRWPPRVLTKINN